MSAMEKKPDGKKKGFFSPVVKYFNEVKSEMKKVVYPTFKQVRKNTIAVIICVIIVGLFIAALDFCFRKAVDNFLLNENTQTTQSGTIDVGQPAEGAEGDAVEGDAAEGDAVEGDAAEGDAAEGNAAEGDAAEGDAAEGDAQQQENADAAQTAGEAE